MPCSADIAVGSAVYVVLTVMAATSADPTTNFLKEIHHRPLMLYACYVTGVTLESEGTVNMTMLWDATQSSADNGKGKTWMAQKCEAGSYTVGSFEYAYDATTSTLQLSRPGFLEEAVILVEPLNGLAYYLRLTVKSQYDKVVYKLYDEDSRCGNAAALLRVADPHREMGFHFVRDVVEPSQICSKLEICADKRSPSSHDG